MLDSNRIATDYFTETISNKIDYDNMGNNKKYDYEFVEKIEHTFPVGQSKFTFKYMGTEHGITNLKFVSKDLDINEMVLKISGCFFDRYSSKCDLSNLEYPFQCLKDNVILFLIYHNTYINTNTNSEFTIEYDLVKIKSNELKLKNVFEQNQYNFIESTRPKGELNNLHLYIEGVVDTIKVSSEQELINPYLTINTDYFLYFTKIDNCHYEIYLDKPINFSRIADVKLCFTHNSENSFNINLLYKNYNTYELIVDSERKYFPKDEYVVCHYELGHKF